MSNNRDFARFVTEFGSKEEEGAKEGEAEESDTTPKKDDSEKRHSTGAGPGLMQAEERNTGAISWDVYKAYSAAGRGQIVLPLLFFSIILIQGATVMSSYWWAALSQLTIEALTHFQTSMTGWCIGKRCMVFSEWSEFTRLADPLYTGNGEGRKGSMCAGFLGASVAPDLNFLRRWVSMPCSEWPKLWPSSSWEACSLR
jgi:hypothetical protein